MNYQNLPSRMESYTDKEHEAYWGDEAPIVEDFQDDESELDDDLD